MKKLIYAILAMASIGAKAEVVTYPAGDGVLTSSDYTVEVRQGGDWQPVAVYPVSVFNVDKAKDAVERASMGRGKGASSIISERSIRPPCAPFREA